MDTVSCIADWYGMPHDKPWRCGDCEVARGDLHHPGCTVARCVDGCGEQAFGSPHLTEH